MKTNKHQTLLLVKAKQAVRAKNLVHAFSYSAPTARSYLSHLKRQELLARISVGHVLTEKGRTRLQFFDLSGCADVACPSCQRKSGFITCPRCAYQMPNTQARILPTQDFLLLIRHAGVYCPRCWKSLLNEAQAQLMGDSQGGRMNTGWEVRPLGWLLFVLLVGALFYYAFTRLKRPPKVDPQTP